MISSLLHFEDYPRELIANGDNVAQFDRVWQVIHTCGRVDSMHAEIHHGDAIYVLVFIFFVSMQIHASGRFRRWS